MSDDTILASIDRVCDGQRAIVSYLLKILGHFEEMKEQGKNSFTIQEVHDWRGMYTAVKMLEQETNQIFSAICRFFDRLLHEMKDVAREGSNHESIIAIEALETILKKRVETLSALLQDLDSFVILIEAIDTMQRNKTACTTDAANSQ